MTTFNEATTLLHKRCDYIEANLGHHSELVNKPAAGKHYRHFILQGLVNTAFYTAAARSMRTIESFVGNLDAVTMSDMHLNELGVLESEVALREQAVDLQALRDYGLDLSNHPSHIGLGSLLRKGGLYDPILQAYESTYGSPSGYDLADKLTSHYKGRELIPSDAFAEWNVQADNLIQQAKDQPLKALLDPQHIVATDGKAGVFSLRRAGFPASQFQGVGTGHNISPHSVYPSNDGQPVPLEGMADPVVVRHCPSLVMVTIECPDNLDELIAGETVEDVALTCYFKHIMVPHWIGLENTFDHVNNAEGETDKPLSQSRLYDPALVSQFAGTLASASIRDDGAEENGNAYGDLVVYTPSDSSLASTAMPHLSDARSVQQTTLYRQLQSLEGKVLSAATNLTSNYGGANAMTMFTDDASQWGQRSGATCHVRFVTSEQFVVAGLRIANGGPSRKWPHSVRLYTKAPDDPSEASDSGWVLHEKVSITPQADAMDVIFTQPAPQTNIFKVEFAESTEGYQSQQYVAFLALLPDEPAA